MFIVVLIILCLTILHHEGTSLFGMVLAISAAAVAGFQARGNHTVPGDDNESSTSPDPSCHCELYGSKKAGIVCCGDHPSVGG